MKSNRLEKVDNFIKHRPLLSSFLFLLILAAAPNFFGIYTGTINSPLNTRTEDIIFSAKWSIFGIWVWIIPVFFISLILCSLITKKSSHHDSLSFPRKFAFAFITSLATILFVLVGIVEDIPRPYAGNPAYLYPLALFTSFFYSAVFGAFIGWQSRVSKTRILVQSIIINLLMGLYLIFGYVINQIGL